jgi:hypothetical protein
MAGRCGSPSQDLWPIVVKPCAALDAEAVASPGADVGGGASGPVADVARVSPVPVQMWQRACVVGVFYIGVAEPIQISKARHLFSPVFSLQYPFRVL